MSRFNEWMWKRIEEAVQKVNVDFIDELEKKYTVDDKGYKERIKLLNSLFKQYDIEFIFKPEYRDMHGSTNLEGHVFIIVGPENLSMDSNVLFRKLKKLVYHEYVHRIQSTKIGDKFSLSTEPLETKDYLADPQEIMAYANGIVTDWLTKLSNDEILSLLKKKDYTKLFTLSNNFKMYYDTFQQREVSKVENYKNRKSLERLFKYIYQYLDGQAKDND